MTTPTGAISFGNVNDEVNYGYTYKRNTQATERHIQFMEFDSNNTTELSYKGLKGRSAEANPESNAQWLIDKARAAATGTHAPGSPYTKTYQSGVFGIKSYFPQAIRNVDRFLVEIYFDSNWGGYIPAYGGSNKALFYYGTSDLAIRSVYGDYYRCTYEARVYVQNGGDTIFGKIWQSGKTGSSTFNCIAKVVKIRYIPPGANI